MVWVKNPEGCVVDIAEVVVPEAGVFDIEGVVTGRLVLCMLFGGTRAIVVAGNWVFCTDEAGGCAAGALCAGEDLVGAGEVGAVTGEGMDTISVVLCWGIVLVVGRAGGPCTINEVVGNVGGLLGLVEVAGIAGVVEVVLGRATVVMEGAIVDSEVMVDVTVADVWVVVVGIEPCPGGDSPGGPTPRGPRPGGPPGIFGRPLSSATTASISSVIGSPLRGSNPAERPRSPPRSTAPPS